MAKPFLSISEKGVLLSASDAAGTFYGMKTLEQLRFQYGDELPCMEIEDKPAYAYRSFHIDTARHFFSIDVLKAMADTAASFKLNQFHWHFSDDQGWRIESAAFPRLHEIGAKRQGDHFGTYSSDEIAHDYYTREEVRELVAYCAERHIEIVPEIDLPGHVTAILAAYPELSCTEKPQQVRTSAGIFPEILCPGKERSFEFLFALLDDLCELFPGKYFHIGGDETPKIRWNACPHCRRRMQEEGLADTRQLQGYLTNRVAAHLRKHGKRVICWNEAALGENLDPDIIVQIWNDDPKDPSLKALSRQKDENGKPTSPNQGIGAKLIRQGHDLIISNMRGSYCDYPYAYIKTAMVHDEPIRLQNCEDIQKEAEEHTLGVEALIWTEYIRDRETLEKMAWPRFAAKADRAWSGDDAGDYTDFAKRMKVLFSYLQQKAPNAAAPSGWMPGPFRAMREMLSFVKNVSVKQRKSYADAQDAV
ncbi:MAG TPA: beta-N-acetylhexosaminidase [Candidatus Faecousia intestinigallinarum]|nr:beta-N-acetylhexosaminidase [Candidatus Faecousia intestinigallinarum]